MHGGRVGMGWLERGERGAEGGAGGAGGGTRKMRSSKDIEQEDEERAH